MAQTNTDLVKLAENVDSAESTSAKPAEPPAQPSPPAPLTSSEDAFSALKALAEIGGLMLALAFVAGWSYMASYYTAFGLNPLELDFSVASTSAFAVHVLRNAVWPLALLAVVFVVLNLKLGKARRLVAGLGVFVLLFSVTFAGSDRGRALAREDMFDTSPRLPTVSFVAKTTPKEDDPSCLRDGTMDCKLLLHTKGTYYYFQPVHTDDANSAGQLSNLNVFMVAESEITNVHVSPGCGANKVTDFDAGGCK
jgi:hypothetical protein